MAYAINYSEEDKRKLDKNSAAWGEAQKMGNQGLMDYWHGESEKIRAGYGVSGGADGSQMIPLAPQSKSYTPEIESMYAAQKASAVAGLDKAYQNSLADLSRAEQSIAPKYQDARNLAAGSSAQEQRAFAEYAAARGLNSGAGGQAELARGNALQSTMGDINRGEADAYADIATQRAKLANEYQFAIARANAEGDFAKAQALYQEYVRQDEAAVSRSKWMAGENRADEEMAFTKEQYEYGKGRDTLADTRYGEETAYSRGEAEYQKQYKMAQEMAQYGDFSGFDALGIDTTQMKAEWARQVEMERAAAAAKASGSTATQTPEGILSESQLRFMMSQGISNERVWDSMLYHYGMTHEEDKRRTQGATLPTGAVSPGGTAAPMGNVSAYPALGLTQFNQPGSMAGAAQTSMEDDIIRRLQSGSITPEQARALMQRYGL